MNSASVLIAFGFPPMMWWIPRLLMPTGRELAAMNATVRTLPAMVGAFVFSILIAAVLITAMAHALHAAETPLEREARERDLLTVLKARYESTS